MEKHKWLAPVLWFGGLGVFLLGMFFVLIIMFFPDIPTSVKFQSSDGEWTENEDLFKMSRMFGGIIYSFELYKIHCNKPEVFLQRITKKPRRGSAEDHLNDYKEMKWEVPYVRPFPHLTTCLESSERERCACSFHKMATEQQKTLARQRADQYIDKKKMEGWTIKKLHCAQGKCQIVTESYGANGELVFEDD
jgi:hypothetical protein